MIQKSPSKDDDNSDVRPKSSTDTGMEKREHRDISEEDLGWVFLKTSTVVYVNPFDADQEMGRALLTDRDECFRVLNDGKRCGWIDFLALLWLLRSSPGPRCVLCII